MIDEPWNWKPKLTPAKLRALRLVVECKDPEGYRARGSVLTSYHPLELMGLIERRGYHHAVPTRAGKRALQNPASYKPVGVL